MVQLSSVVAALAAGAVVVEGRPRAAAVDRRDVASCAQKLAANGAPARMVKRREETLKQLRKRLDIGADAPHQSLEKRQLAGGYEQLTAWALGASQGAEAATRDHKTRKNLPASPGAAPKADWDILGAGRSVVLAPDVTEGPFYVTGQTVRKNVREKEPGVPLFLDLQVIDITTCQPLANAAIDLFQANATGVYSGVDLWGNGNGGMNPGHYQTRALRGVQITGSNGAVQFETIFPGHYIGRTNHINLVTSVGGTVKDNVVSGGSTAHVGQVYFDQNLIDAVEGLAPYNSNGASRIRNSRDLLVTQGVGGGADPFVEYTLLGNDIQDGIFAWINYAINPSVKRKVLAMATCEQDRCKPAEIDWITEFANWFNLVSSYQFNPPSPQAAAGGPPDGTAGIWEALTNALGLGRAPAPPPAVAQQTTVASSPRPTIPATASTTTTAAAPLGTTPGFPNTEGALIGAGILGIIAALVGGIAGAFSTWTFANFQDQLMALFNVTNGNLSNSIWGPTPATAAIPSGAFDSLAQWGSLLGWFTTPPVTYPVSLPVGLPTTATVPATAASVPTPAAPKAPVSNPIVPPALAPPAATPTAAVASAGAAAPAISPSPKSPTL